MVAWWVAVGAARAEPLTLADALDRALSANPELRQEEIRLEQAELARVAAAGAYDPVLFLSADTNASSSPSNAAIDGTDRLVSRWSGWSATVGQALPTGATTSLAWTETYSSSNSANVVSASTVADTLSLSVSQPLLGGRTALVRGVRSASLAADDAALAHREATEQLVLDVSGAYWRLVSAREAHALAVRSREVAVQSLADARERFDEGFAGSGDVHQVERALGTAAQAEVIAAAEVEAARADLQRLLGADVAQAADLDPVDRPVVPATSPSSDDVLASARENNAQWLRDRLALERAELGVKIARDAALPDLDVTGRVSTSGLDDAADGARREALSAAYDGWGLGASLSVPLPGRAIRTALASARLDRESARLALVTAEQDLVLRVQAAVRAVDRDRSRASLAEDTVRYAQLALEADQELLRDGKGATRDVVLSLESLAQAEADALLARIDLQASLLELDRVAGTLVGPDRGQVP